MSTTFSSIQNFFINIFVFYRKFVYFFMETQSKFRNRLLNIKKLMIEKLGVQTFFGK